MKVTELVDSFPTQYHLPNSQNNKAAFDGAQVIYSMAKECRRGTCTLKAPSPKRWRGIDHTAGGKPAVLNVGQIAGGGDDFQEGRPHSFFFPIWSRISPHNALGEEI